jgi:hypothetical protein
MIAARSAAWVAVAIVILAAAPASAQSSQTPGRVGVGFGLIWTGSQSLGSSDATETTGSGGDLVLFRTSSELTSRVGIEGRVGVRVWRSLEAEASGTYATPQIRTQITGDFEGAAPITATEKIQQFSIVGGILWRLPAIRHGSKLTPFLTGGGGYLRQLHEGDTLAESGQLYQIGGGVEYPFASPSDSFVKRFGVRADARAVIRSKGVALDDGHSVSPALTASLYARF